MTLLLGNFFHAMVVTGTTPFFRALYSVNCEAKGLFLSNGSWMAFGRKSVLDSGTLLLARYMYKMFFTIPIKHRRG